MLYREMVTNFSALHGQVVMAEHDASMRENFQVRFSYGFKTFAYDLAQKDASTFYSLGSSELYWMGIFYGDQRHVIDGTFDSLDQHLMNASFVANHLVTCVKNRYMHRRTVFRVSPPWVKKYLRKELPRAYHVDTSPPGRRERLLRKWDTLQYWWWQKSARGEKLLAEPATARRSS